MPDQLRILKNCWIDKDKSGLYWFYFKVGEETWMLNLSFLNPELSEGESVIEQKLDTWIASQGD